MRAYVLLLFVAVQLGAVYLGPLGCAVDAARKPKPAHRTDAPNAELHAPGSLVLPGVEVEVLAARLAGRGDSSLEFLVGREGGVEKRCSIRSVGGFRPGFVEPPSARSVSTPGKKEETLAVELADDARDSRMDVRPLAEEESEVLRRAVQVAIVAASTPDVFEAPAEFIEDPKRDRAPWRKLNPPVRLRVDLNWLERRESSLFEGTWLIMTSPSPSESERVVLNVVGWRNGPQRSRPLQVLLSRGYIPERQIDVQNHQGSRAQELIKAVREHGSDRVLPDVERHSSEPLWTWFAMSHPLRVEVDGAGFHGLHSNSSGFQESPPGRPNFDGWVILNDDQRP